MKRLEWWEREHRISSVVVVTLGVGSSRIDTDWLVRAHGWDLPSQFPIVYPTLEAAQRALDDVLLNNQPHDCRRCACGEWKIVQTRAFVWTSESRESPQ